MAAPEQKANPEAVTPTPAREPTPDSKVDVSSAAADVGPALQPWEQHAAVINLPRYDYRASGSLLLRSCSGFLITCPIKREKSATKEAISILDKYIGHVNVLENSEPCDMKIAVKKRKLCSETTENLEEAVIKEHTDASESTGIDNSNSPQSNTSEDVDKTSKLSLVKLSRSGLLFFKFPSGGFHVVQMLTEILHSLKSGKLNSPHDSVQRIVLAFLCLVNKLNDIILNQDTSSKTNPVQILELLKLIHIFKETCVLSETELHATVSKLFCDFLRSKKDQDEPVKFAVAYNRRGIYETEMKPPKNSNEGSNQQVLMNRDQCFKVVAAAVKSIAEKSVVDLRSPEVAILIEMLPLSGVPLGSSVAGVSVLPAELISTKPRLCVRSLVMQK